MYFSGEEACVNDTKTRRTHDSVVKRTNSERGNCFGMNSAVLESKHDYGLTLSNSEGRVFLVSASVFSKRTPDSGVHCTAFEGKSAVGVKRTCSERKDESRMNSTSPL
jgi:hypothetical protein